MEYLVKIDEFEGPLDLLLHLIKTSEKEIFEISISQITNQYIQYLKDMDNLELNYASEYLILAAELINIKTLMLLPKPQIEESDYVEDPREKLIERLIEYKKYKEVTTEFSKMKEEREHYYTRFCEPQESVDIVNVDTNVDMYDLLKALQKMNQRKILDQPLTTVIEKSEISVEERMKTLLNSIKIQKKVVFTELFDNYTKSYVITTFLAVLELVKENKILITELQDEDFEISYISR